MIGESKWCYAYSDSGQGFFPLNFIKLKTKIDATSKLSISLFSQNALLSTRSSKIEANENVLII